MYSISLSSPDNCFFLLMVSLIRHGLLFPSLWVSHGIQSSIWEDIKHAIHGATMDVSTN